MRDDEGEAKRGEPEDPVGTPNSPQSAPRPEPGMLGKFRAHWTSYVLQCLLATVTVWVVLVLLSQRNAVIIASIGATAFIVFAIPKNVLAGPRNVLGGYVVGMACGSLCHLIPHGTMLHSTLVYAFAVGLSIFIMVVIDTEHPPASGVALGFAIKGFDLNVAITVVVSMLVLSGVRSVFKEHLRDLT